MILTGAVLGAPGAKVKGGGRGAGREAEAAWGRGRKQCAEEGTGAYADTAVACPLPTCPICDSKMGKWGQNNQVLQLNKYGINSLPFESA